MTRSRPFFELKSELNKKLEQQKQRVVKIDEGIEVCKNAYQQTLRNLQHISEDIHNTRNEKKAAAASNNNSPVMSVKAAAASNNNSPVMSVKSDAADKTVGEPATVVVRHPSVASSEVSLGSDDNATWKPGLLDPGHDNISLSSRDEFNIDRCSSTSSNATTTSASEQLKNENESSECRRTSGASLVMEVTDAMKAMQSDISSPFECITSHTLEYSVPKSPADVLDGNSVNKGE